MAELENRTRDWFAPLMTLATVVVAVWSLYYSGVQADVARKTFEITVNEAHAGIQKDLADLQRQVAAGSTDRSTADLLVRLADLQAKLAEQQRQGGNSLADIQHQMADLQASLARMLKEQDHKDREIASLRASAATATVPRLTTPLLTITGTLPLTSLPKDFPLVTNKIGLPPTWKMTPTPVAHAADESLSGRGQAILRNIGSIFSEFPIPAGYFVLASLVALSKLFGRK